VITRHSGRRELLIYSERDPDAAAHTVRLGDDDRQALVELLGGSQVASTVTELRQNVEGVAIDWLLLQHDHWAAGHSIADTQMRRRTGVSVVAILRGETTIPSPEPTQGLDAGDTLVVVGTPEGIEAASIILRAG
jgi:TrkA domain protein